MARRWAALAIALVLPVSGASAGVVINEIHNDHPDNTARAEFVELHNPGSADAAVSGWRLSGGIDFAIPEGVVVPAGGYLLVAQDPEALRGIFALPAGVAVLGPWTGRLNNDGETLRLRDTADQVVDRVEYALRFPWPIASSGEGASMELVNPALDNDLGSSWRPGNVGGSGPLEGATYFAPGSAGWRWRPGDSEASAPAGAWRGSGFVEDGTWQPAQLPIGYGNVTGVEQATVIAGMQANYPSVFLRNGFVIEPGETPAELALRTTCDDGFILWINGHEVLRANVEDGVEPVAGAGGTTAQSDSAEGVWSDAPPVVAPAFLVEGENTIAVQVFNASVGSSDLAFDFELLRPPVTEVVYAASPGARNLAYAENAAPNIRQVAHSPSAPAAADPVVVTAKVTDPDGVAAVTLEYQVVAPGEYLPSHLPHPVVGGNIPLEAEPLGRNPAYDSPANWTALAMVDDGSGGDAAAGDDVFTAVLPARPHRHLVRYRITTADAPGASHRAPFFDDPSLNFAYFVYDGLPDYTAADSNQGGAQTYPAAELARLPVYHVITRAEDWRQCYAYSSRDQITQGNLARFAYNWPGTIVYDGVVYDNIRYRLRGANGRYYNTGKRSMRFRLNPGHYLQAQDLEGEPFARPWRTLTTGKGFDNRRTQTFGLNEVINMYLFNKVGVPAAEMLWMHLRVIDGAEEAPDQWNGDFHGAHLISETYDIRFLESHGLEKGNLYKLINQTTSPAQQQRYQAPDAVSNGADHQEVERNFTGARDEAYLRAHINIEKYCLMHALAQAFRHYDYWPSANKNMVYYFAPPYTAENGGFGQLWILPWDTDATWGPSWNSGDDVVYNTIFPGYGSGSDSRSNPGLWPDYFNAVRAVRDLVWQPDQVEPLLDYLAAKLEPLVLADYDRWKGAPAASGNYNGLAGKGMTSLDALVRDMKNFAFLGAVNGSNWSGVGGNDSAIPQANDSGISGREGRDAFLDWLLNSRGEEDLVPATPVITYTGEAGFPADGLAFRSSAFADPQGAATFGAIEWRIAEVTDPDAPAYDPAAPPKLEWEAEYQAGPFPTFAADHAVPTAAVRPDRSYRARVRHQDNSGRWSHWSAPVAFTAAAPDIAAYLDHLVVSEVMYHPEPPSAAEAAAGYEAADFEWVEIHNAGPAALDLSPLRFTKGIDFDFDGSGVNSIAPGQFLVVARNAGAFAARYGSAPDAAWSPLTDDRLDNAGEQLKLSFGAGTAVRDFVYGDSSPWPESADGDGFSLTLTDPSKPAPPLDHAVAANWRASLARGGTPGAGPATGPLVAWMAAHGVTDLSSDDDRDGLEALLEFMLAGDPNSAASAPRPTVALVAEGADRFLALTYTRPAGADDVVRYDPEASDTLATWQPADSRAAETTVTPNGDGTETVTIRLALPPGAEGPEFLRLRGTVR
jgi:hypothetical protein